MIRDGASWWGEYKDAQEKNRRYGVINIFAQAENIWYQILEMRMQIRYRNYMKKNSLKNMMILSEKMIFSNLIKTRNTI